jgi:hypothetical protein
MFLTFGFTSIKYTTVLQKHHVGKTNVYFVRFVYRWLREFLEEPYNGHEVLIDFMAFLHKNPPPPPLSLDQEMKKSQKSSKSGKRRKKVMARSHVSVAWIFVPKF